MGRYGLRQLCAFVLPCGVYFGGIPQMYFLRVRGIGADDFVAFAFEAVLAWLLLAAVCVYWRQLTPLAVHCLCVALSLLMLLVNPDVAVQAKHFALAPLGPSCWAAILISFPVSFVLLAVSAVLGRRIEPLTNRLGRDFFFLAISRPNHSWTVAPFYAESRFQFTVDRPEESG